MIEVEVRPDEGDNYTVTITSRDVRAWEKAGRGRKLDVEGGVSFTALYELTWRAAKRGGKFEGALTDFEDTNDIEPLGESEVDPTSGGR